MVEIESVRGERQAGPFSRNNPEPNPMLSLDERCRIGLIRPSRSRKDTKCLPSVNQELRDLISRNSRC